MPKDNACTVISLRVFDPHLPLDTLLIPSTVNVDIFACINIREFTKIDNFASIYVRVFDNIASKWHNLSYFHVIHIFANIAKICTA